MANELMAKGILVALCVAGVHLGLLGLLNYNMFQQFFPTYVKWIYIGLGAIGGWTLYTIFKR